MQVFNNKDNIREAVKTVAFFCILAILFASFSVISEKILLSSDRLVPVRNKNIYRILREPEDSTDIIILGDSLSYSSISPMSLWGKYGYTAYVCGQSGQKIQETDEMLKTVLKKQSPKVVILETNVLFRNRVSDQSLEAAIGTLLDYRIPVFRGHDVWKSVIMNKEYVEENYKGFAFRCSVAPYKKGNYMKKTKDTETMSDTVLIYMDNIIEQCRNNGIELVLVSTPSPANYNYARHNTLSKYAQKKGLKFLDMNLRLDEIGLDWKTDSLDKGDHLNVSGAEKTTAFLGKYLSETYRLTDHREDSSYSNWSAEYKKYQKKAVIHLAKIRGDN